MQNGTGRAIIKGRPSENNFQTAFAHESGSRHIQTATQKQNPADTAPIHHFSGNRQNKNRHETVIILNAKYFARRGTAWLRSQFCTIGPKRGCRCSQRWKRGEAFAQQAAASNTNGVVGNIGRKMPIMPNASESAPQVQKK